MSNLIQNQCTVERITFSAQENAIWQKLYYKQVNNLQDKAFSTYLENFKKLDLPTDTVPKISDISNKLKEATGWKVVPVDGLLESDTYFTLLSEMKFPSTTFIRTEQDENLSKDPDIFHEVFGHCIMLLSQEYADFLKEFARFFLTIPNKDRSLFARLLWFTTETGLIRAGNLLKIYGSSIMSSYAESIYCLESSEPIRKPFDVVDIFRQPYRADMLQRVYYVIDSVDQVYNLLDDTDALFKSVKIARKQGELPALFPIEHNKYTNIGHCVDDALTLSDTSV